MDLKETIGKHKIESRAENYQKVKEVASEAHIKLESELNSVKFSLWVELEKNEQLQEELGNSERKQPTIVLDSGCSKHMTGSANDFLSLKALQGGSVSFENGKKGYILGVRRIAKSLSHSI
ncbi:uncharacterized protein [Nicotiana sylvestris]|uniref:uncharacterized protein n=1 Tax=Nicotiana sylvestris TaxID=4096 RepID=UPI00388C91DE